MGLPVIMMVEHVVIETDGNSVDGRIIVKIVNVWILMQDLKVHYLHLHQHVRTNGLLRNAKNHATRRIVVKTRIAKRPVIHVQNNKKSVIHFFPAPASLPFSHLANQIPLTSHFKLCVTYVCLMSLYPLVESGYVIKGISAPLYSKILDITYSSKL